MTPLFRAYDRGIVVASLYAGTLIICAQIFLLPGSPFQAHAALWGVCGFVAGAIGGFSNTDAADSLRRDAARNACDAVMIAVWTANLLLFVNLLRWMGSLSILAQLFGFFAAATLLGALVGEPMLLFAASLSIRGRRPFAAANGLAASLHNRDARFVAKVVLHTVVVGGLLLLAAAVAFVVMMIVAFFIAIAILVLVLKAMTSDGQKAPSRTFRIRRDEAIDDEGRIVQKGWFFDTPTGRRVNPEGQIVNEGFFTDERTGLKIAKDGRVQKEGFFFDEDTGVRLEDDGRGGRRVIKEGWMFDEDTGRRINADGRAVKEGFFFDREEGLEIDEDGNVRSS